MVWAHGSILQTKSRVLSPAPIFWTCHTYFALLLYTGPVAISMRSGTSPQQLEVQGGCLPSSFCDSAKLLGGRRYLWMCDSHALRRDVSRAETVADFNCNVPVENKQILLKSCLNLKKSALYFLVLTIMLADILQSFFSVSFYIQLALEPFQLLTTITVSILSTILQLQNLSIQSL